MPCSIIGYRAAHSSKEKMRKTRVSEVMRQCAAFNSIVPVGRDACQPTGFNGLIAIVGLTDVGES